MQTQNLQIIPRGIKPIIKASQFDVGREFQLKLYDGAVAYTPPTGTALRLDGVKPDGTVFSYTENLSLSGSTITVTTTTQMTILEGTVQCEIRMTKDNDDIGTINFDLMVEKSPINETTDLSQTEVPALVTLARTQMENAEAWAVGTKDGEPVSPDDPQYNNSAKYWAQQVGGETQDAEAWAVGTKDGVPVTSDDPQYHNNAKYYSDEVQTAAQTAAEKALVSEGYATGKQNGTDVASTSPYYHNNAAYYAGQAADDASTAGQAAARAEAAVVLEPYIGANGNWYVYDFSTSAYVDTGVNAIGATGNGIASVAKTSTSGLVDTYTITYTDGTTSTFTVTNGEDGQDGAPGATGNGIVSITKTSTSGLVDTYTILYTNGTTSTFTVTNGQNGTGAGDMLSADYDPTQAVFNAGGIVAYVASQISGLSISLNGLTDVALNNLAAGQTLAYNATSQKWENTSLATVATSGSYADLNNKPTLGTAAAKNSTNAVTQSSTDLVESGAVYSEVTSLNSAIANKADSSKAYQTDDTTETTLASDDVLPFYDTSATAKRKMTVQKFGEQLISNPNLLDNPWFTVNQRGQSSYTNGRFGPDRWWVGNSGNTLTVNNDNSVTFSNSSSFAIIYEKLEAERMKPLYGREVTFSVLFGDGTIVSKSEKLPSSTPVQVTDYCNLTSLFDNGFATAIYLQTDGSAVIQIGVTQNHSLTVKAVKLEIGTVSTLAIDTAPNYAEELLKCQRYFYRFHVNNGIPLGFGFSTSTTQARLGIVTPVPLRGRPSVSASGNDILSVVCDGSAKTSTGFAQGYHAGNIVYVIVNVASGLPGENYVTTFRVVTNNSYIDLSADL